MKAQTTKKMFHSNGYSKEQLDYIHTQLDNQIIDLLDFFDIHYVIRNNYITCCCPIHGGDNPTACNIYNFKNDDDYYKPYFKCRTHFCEKTFGSRIFSLIRGILSHRNYNWTCNTNKETGFLEALDFVVDYIQYDGQVSKLKPNTSQIFCKTVDLFNRTTPTEICSKKEFLSTVVTPSKYYIKRGFSSQILEMLDVGDCYNHTTPMYKHAVIPVYDENDQDIIGLTARSIYEKCKKCQYYHNPDGECRTINKWLNSKNFEKTKCLYNYGKAKAHILKNSFVIITESPGNVWRLLECGLYNSVATLGASLSKTQKDLIDESGAMSIVYIQDNDPAGDLAKQEIIKKCQHTHNIFFPKISGQDAGEMNTQQLLTELLPTLNIVKELYL